MAKSGQVALVSGAGSGVGRAIALEMAAMGMNVGLLGRNHESLAETARLAGVGADRLAIIPCDVSDRNAVDAAASDLHQRFGAADLLVCNAGINVTKRGLEQLDPADWDRMIATNLTGSYNLVRAVLPGMRARKNGLVVMICSVSGKRASTLGGVGYSASKFGQAALGLCLGREERRHGIRSTVIYPGEINTPILDRRPEPVPAERRERILQPEDLAAAVRFLVELPPRASVPELIITPSMDEWF